MVAFCQQVFGCSRCLHSNKGKFFDVLELPWIFGIKINSTHTQHIPLLIQSDCNHKCKGAYWNKFIPLHKSPRFVCAIATLFFVFPVDDHCLHLCAQIRLSSCPLVRGTHFEQANTNIKLVSVVQYMLLYFHDFGVLDS